VSLHSLFFIYSREVWPKNISQAYAEAVPGV